MSNNSNNSGSRSNSSNNSHSNRDVTIAVGVTIICTVATAAIAFVGGMMIGKKQRGGSSRTVVTTTDSTTTTTVPKQLLTDAEVESHLWKLVQYTFTASLIRVCDELDLYNKLYNFHNNGSSSSSLNQTNSKNKPVSVKELATKYNWNQRWLLEVLLQSTASGFCIIHYNDNDENKNDGDGNDDNTSSNNITTSNPSFTLHPSYVKYLLPPQLSKVSYCGTFQLCAALSTSKRIKSVINAVQYGVGVTYDYGTSTVGTSTRSVVRGGNAARRTSSTLTSNVSSSNSLAAFEDAQQEQQQEEEEEVVVKETFENEYSFDEDDVLEEEDEEADEEEEEDEDVSAAIDRKNGNFFKYNFIPEIIDTIIIPSTGQKLVDLLDSSNDTTTTTIRRLYVADIGCGCGASTIAMAKRFPNVTFYAYEASPRSIQLMKDNILKENVGSNIIIKDVTKPNNTIGDLPSDFKFQFVYSHDVLHDMTHPKQLINEIKSKLDPTTGCWYIVDVHCGNTIKETLAQPNAATLYGFSCLLCLSNATSSASSSNDNSRNEGLGTCGFTPQLAKQWIQQDAKFTYFERRYVKSLPSNACYLVGY